MQREIEHLTGQFESGRISRRGFIAAIAGLAVAGRAKASEQDGSPLFEATAVNHVALRVTDVTRSRDFYKHVLGLSGSGSFLYCGSDFVALFSGSQPGLDHFAFSIRGFDREAARERLRANNIEPIIEGSRTYFRDPDGIKLQLQN